MNPLLTAISLVLLAAHQAAGHGFLAVPRSRNVLSRHRHQQWDPHGFNSGGTGAVYANTEALPSSVWPYPETTASSKRHGLCGDKVGDLKHQVGGAYYTGEIQETYAAGSSVEFEVSVTTHHNGHFEFFLCDRGDLKKRNGAVTQECLNEHRLERDAGDTAVSPFDSRYPGRFFLPPKCLLSRSNYGFIDGYQVKMRYRLPAGLECEHCVLQWYYVTANSCNPPGYDTMAWPSVPKSCPVGDGGAKGWWGDHLSACDNTKDGHLGAFPEEFWNCADIKIVADDHVSGGGGGGDGAQNESQNGDGVEEGRGDEEKDGEDEKDEDDAPSPAVQGCAAEFGTCGGEGQKAAATCCQAGLTCVKQSRWYSQCLAQENEESEDEVKGTSAPVAVTTPRPRATQNPTKRAAPATSAPVAATTPRPRATQNPTKRAAPATAAPAPAASEKQCSDFAGKMRKCKRSSLDCVWDSSDRSCSEREAVSVDCGAFRNKRKCKKKGEGACTWLRKGRKCASLEN